MIQDQLEEINTVTKLYERLASFKLEHEQPNDAMSFYAASEEGLSTTNIYPADKQIPQIETNS